MKHTLLPWKADKNGVITGGDSYATSIAETYFARSEYQYFIKYGNQKNPANPQAQKHKEVTEQLKNDAQFIVTACNSHYELVEVLERVSVALTEQAWYEVDWHDLQADITNALKKAKGE